MIEEERSNFSVIENLNLENIEKDKKKKVNELSQVSVTVLKKVYPTAQEI